MKFKALAIMLGAAFAALAGTPSKNVTFYKDVVPVLQSRCQECHRPGEVAPMSFLTYEQVRPWSKAIKSAVVTKKMPPWFADPHFGKFSNDRALSQTEIDTLVSWIDGGSKEGNAKDAPKPREWVEGWQIGKPDQVLEMPVAINIPATGVIEYTYVVIPTGFTEDKWIQMAEARPEARSAMHHVIAFIRPPGSAWLADAQPGVPFIPGNKRAAADAPQTPKAADGAAKPAPKPTAGADQTPGELLVGFAPGLPPTECKPGEAKLVKAGSDIVLQLHYTPNGKATSDRSKIGLIFAKGPVERRVMTMNAMNAFLKIPPNDSNYEAHAQITLKQDVTLVSLMPHMHVRGKDFIYKAVYPTGETEVLLNVPHYDFNWQLSYFEDKQLVLPKNTRIECTAHYDNSVNNAANPDPNKEVHWGDQTWEEMMIGWFDVSVDVKADTSGLRNRGRSE